MKLSEEQIATLLNCKDAQEAVSKLAEQGVTMSLDEVEKLKGFNEFASLDEADLSGVSGACNTVTYSGGAAVPCDDNYACPGCHSKANSVRTSCSYYGNEYHCYACHINYVDSDV